MLLLFFYCLSSDSFNTSQGVFNLCKTIKYFLVLKGNLDQAFLLYFSEGFIFC